MAEYRRAPEAGQLPRAWTRGRTETGVQRVRSWTVQNEKCPQALHEGFSILPILER